MDAFGRIIAIILAAILMVLFPLQYLAINQKEAILSHVKSETTKFTDEIMLQGYITLDMYKNYVSELDSTGQLYDVELVHSKPIEGYNSGSLSNLYPKDNFLHTSAEYDASEISIATSCKGLASNRNKFITSESKGVLNSMSLMATHVHTNACYEGHRHTGNSSTYGGCYTKYMPQYCGGTTFTFSRYLYKYSGTCTCGRSLYFYDETKAASMSRVTCGNCGRSPTLPFESSVEAYKCNTCGYESVGLPTSCKNVISYYWGTGCGQTEDTTLECDDTVVSITANSSTQTVALGSAIDTTAIATYLDGHSGTVNCTSNYISKLGTQMVTLTFTGLVDTVKTIGTKTCITTVTTTSEVPASLTVIPSSYEVYNGQEPTYTVKVFYHSGASKIITTGYTKTGFTVGAGTKTVTFSYTEYGTTVSASVTITVKRNTATCTYGHTYELDDFDTDNGCPTCNLTLKSINASPNTITVKKGAALNISLTATFNDGHTQVITTGWTSDYNSSQAGEQLVTITYSGLTITVNVTVEDTIQCPICGTTYPVNSDGSDPGCPICSKKVTGISATPATQDVLLGENILLEVTATYMDGHKEMVTEWTSTFNPYKVGEQTVLVYYQTKSTTVTATVISDAKTTCPICGTVYNPIEYPYGCPICSKTVDSIEAKLRNGGTQVQYGSELNLAVVLIYRDGHREIAYNDYSVDGYQPDILGVQTLTITYKNLQTTLNIEVVNTLSKTVCPNGHVYFRNEDGSDPGCLYCNQDTKKNSGEDYFDSVYTEVILTELYKNEIYYFNDGDYITVSVTPKTLTIYNKLENMFQPKAKSEKQYSYGGIIGNDEYF